MCSLVNVHNLVFAGLLYPAYIMLTASVICPAGENRVNKNSIRPILLGEISLRCGQ